MVRAGRVVDSDPIRGVRRSRARSQQYAETEVPPLAVPTGSQTRYLARERPATERAHVEAPAAGAQAADHRAPLPATTV